MPPGDQLTLRVQASLQDVASGGAVEIVADVILARPDDLHGSADIAGNEGGFNGVILNEAAAETTADERDVYFDMIARNAQSAGDGIRGGSGNLRGRPELAEIATNVRRAIDGLHRSVSEERHFVDGIDFLRGNRVSLVEITVAVDDGSRFGSKANHFFAKASGGFGGTGWLVPLDLEELAGSHGGPSGIGDDGNAGAGIVAAARAGGLAELVRQMNGLHFDDGADMRSGFHFARVEAARRAAVHGAAFDGRHEHSGDAGVQAKLAGACYFGERVGTPRWLADEDEVRRILQWRIGRRLKCGGGRYEFLKGKLALGGCVEDKAIFSAAFGARNIPFSSSRGNQRFASGSAGLAQIVVRIADAAAAAGELFAILRVEVGLHDLDAAPIAAELLSHDHRERCANTLPHFRFAAPDFYIAAWRYFEPSG